MGIGMPRYFYTSDKNLVRAQIVLPDLTTFQGDLCSNHDLAAENAATKVCKEMNLERLHPNPRQFFDMLPPDAWMNPHPSMNIQPLLSPRPFPDSQKPNVRPPANWNPRMPQQSPGFAQMPSVRVNQMRPSAPELKPDVKQSTPFVPLQAQKKRNRKPKEPVPTTQDGNIKEINPPKQQKAKPKNNSPKIGKTDKPTKQNEVIGMSKDNNPTVQKVQKAPRQRKSRIAANFGSSPAANGGDGQK